VAGCAALWTQSTQKSHKTSWLSSFFALNYQPLISRGFFSIDPAETIKKLLDCAERRAMQLTSCLPVNRGSHFPEADLSVSICVSQFVSNTIG
jgi:hypothetical protein